MRGCSDRGSYIAPPQRVGIALLDAVDGVVTMKAYIFAIFFYVLQPIWNKVCRRFVLEFVYVFVNRS